MNISSILSDETRRRREFPSCAHGIFMAHGGVCALPRVAVEAMAEFAELGSRGMQENRRTEEVVAQCRADSARLIGASPDEITLLGPTALGLNMIASGLSWNEADEVVYYGDDYPSNVYPWAALTAFGVKPVALQPRWAGVITWELIEPLLTARTRLVALATCNFLSGFRIDVESIGPRLRERGILFCLDAIQTLGAFPMNVQHVDFLCADSHKWLLGPAGAGLIYVKQERKELVRPTLLGSWNVVSPDFVAQHEIVFENGGRRYEPGTLNLPGIFGMTASMRMLLDIGIENVAVRLLELRRIFVDALRAKGYRLYLEEWDRAAGPAGDKHRTAIITVHRPGLNMTPVAQRLRENGVTLSLRKNRAGDVFLRFSPHFYNTEAELDRILELM